MFHVVDSSPDFRLSCRTSVHSCDTSLAHGWNFYEIHSLSPLSFSLSFSLCLFRYLPDLAWNWTKCNRSFATSKCVTWAALPLREELTSLEICCKATVPTVEEQTDFLKLRSLWVEFAYVRIGIELSSFESGSNEKTKEEKYIYMISVMDYFRLF